MGVVLKNNYAQKALHKFGNSNIESYVFLESVNAYCF